MKKTTVCAILSVMMILSTALPVNAGGLMERYELSPAMELISERLTLNKCISYNSELKLSAKDFEEVLGRDVEFITVSTLPEPSAGVIKYAGRELTGPITVSRKNASLLKFSPNSKTGTATFSVCADGESDIPVTCNVSILEKENSAPQANEMTINVYSGIAHTGTFDVSDPDGDSVSVSVTAHPKNGTVQLSGNSFVYTPSQKSKKDSFTFVATDIYGNKTEPITVNFKITEPKTDIRYSDMDGHWGYGAAMKMTELGLMTGTVSDGTHSFLPDGETSRGDFLAMAMICAGLEEEINLGAVSAFADDKEIPSNIRSYAALAMSSGMVSGYKAYDGKSVFNSTDGITRAEAATMLANILGVSASATTLDFQDANEIPEWSRKSFAALCSLGIINGSSDKNLNPCEILTKAEAAQLLSNVTEHMEKTEEKKSFWEKIGIKF